MSKQVNPYVVQQVVLSSGERLPFLCTRETGVPIFMPTVFALTELRATNLATATIAQALRAVMVLQLTLDDLGISLTKRMDEGRLLDLGEIEALVQRCGRPIELLVEELAAKEAGARFRVVRPDRAKAQRTLVQPYGRVHSGTAAIRLLYVHRYLKWRATDRLLRMDAKNPLTAASSGSFDLSLKALFERISTGSNRNTARQREGLSEEHLTVLEEVVKQDSLKNPWKGTHARARNELVVRWLLDLGIRRGELLGIRIKNINFQKDEVLIARQADDPDDPRSIQPNTKTRDRLLPLGERLSKLTRDYIQGPRRAIKGARKHDFLIVANGSGRPLTQAATNKIFHVLRTKIPELPDDLYPHILRHTWNDEFSEVMDRGSVPEEREIQMRSRLMGWSETSGTAATYTRRHTKKKADKASIELQNGLTKKGKGKLDEQ